MPIFTINNLKLTVLNEDKTRGISVEYPRDMGLCELSERIKELQVAIEKGIEADSQKEEAPSQEDQAQKID